MASYLDRIGAGAVLAEPEVLDFDWMPPELVGRDPVQRELAAKFSTLAPLAHGISDFSVAVLGKIPDLAILAEIDQK